MSLQDQSTLRVVLYEGEGAQPLETHDRLAAFTALLDQGFAVTRTVAGGRVAPADHSFMLVLGRFADGRAPEAEAPGSGADLRFQDITGFDTARIADTVEATRAATNAAKHGDWKPWFPVIDYDRCTNCMQCLSFCLFGVYKMNANSSP